MRSFPRRPMVIVLSTVLAGTAAAATPTVTGLGQAWPNTNDVSRNPDFHAYQFDMQGVRYVQINDRNGTVRGAVAYIAGQVLELPIGVDASRWTVTETPIAPSSSETVYQADGMTVQAATQTDGTMRLLLATTDCQAHPENCGNKGP